MTQHGAAGKHDPLWLESIRPGMRLPLPDLSCDAETVSGYAELMNAKHPIHVDEAYAKASRFGRCIVHGPLPVAASLAMLGEVFGQALLVLLDIGEWRFLAPIFVGAQVKLECFVLGVEAPRGASSGTVSLEIRVFTEDGGLAQRGMARILVQRKPPASS